MLSVVDGSRLWSVDCGRVRGVLACDDRHVACSTDGGLHVFTWARKQVARREDALAGIPPVLIGDTALYCAAESLEYVRLTAGAAAAPKRLLRAEKSFYGDITAPPILADSQVFLGTSRRGLVCVRGRK